MSIEVELQIASHIKTLPHPSQFREWVGITFNNRINDAEITIRIVDEEESAHLNKRYRNKDVATNVLSFPISIDDLNSYLLGDLVVCAPVIEQEAHQYNKELLEHWAHITIHGLLHLLGYDHNTDSKAHVMESLETDLMLQLGFAPPYAE